MTRVGKESLQAVTDENGTFSLPHDARSDGIFSAACPGYGTVYERIRPLTSEGEQIPDIELEQSVVVVGNLEGFEGETQLNAVSKKSWFVHQRFRERAVYTEPKSVRITDVPPRASLVLEARDRHGRIGIVETRPGSPGETVDFATLRPTETAALGGQITGCDVDQATVLRVRVRRDSLILRDLSYVVDGTNYMLNELPLGQAEAWVERENTRGVIARVDLERGDNRLDLDYGGTIRGVVYDEERVGVADVIIRVITETEEFSSSTTTRSDLDGQFVCAGLDRAVSHRVLPLGGGNRGGEVVPNEVEDVICGGPPLEFVVRPHAWSLDGRIGDAIVEDIRSDLLSVEGRSQRDSVSTSVQSDGTFSLAVPHAGPWTLRLMALNARGKELVIYRVEDVDEIRDVKPGDRLEFQRDD